MKIPSWDEIMQRARKSEVHVSDEKDGWVAVRKLGRINSIYRDTEAGRLAAQETLERYEAVLEAVDAESGKEPPRKRLLVRLFLIVVLLALLWNVAITVADTVVVRQVRYVPCHSSCGIYYPTIVPYATPVHAQHHR